MTLPLYRRVVLTQDLPEEGLRAGDIGVVVEQEPLLEAAQEGLGPLQTHLTPEIDDSALRSDSSRPGTTARARMCPVVFLSRQRLALRLARDRRRIVDLDDMYFLEASGTSTLVRLRGAKRLRDVRGLGELLARSKTAASRGSS